MAIKAMAVDQGWFAANENEQTPPVHYMPCPDHEAAIEVEGYCPCFDGLEIDWERTLRVTFCPSGDVE